MWKWRYSTIILDLNTRWKWVVSFTPWLHYLWQKSPQKPLDMKLGGSQSKSELQYVLFQQLYFYVHSTTFVVQFTFLQKHCCLSFYGTAGCSCFWGGLGLQIDDLTWSHIWTVFNMCNAVLEQKSDWSSLCLNYLCDGRTKVFMTSFLEGCQSLKSVKVHNSLRSTYLSSWS
jgi:hypothetical protein